MLRAVLDCNVLVAALLSREGTPADLLRRWLEGEFELVASGELVRELERVLAYPKIERRLRDDQAERFLLLVRDEAVIAPDPTPSSTAVEELPADPDDAYLIRLAIAARAVIVSGDRHLIAMAPKFPVYTPAAFVVELQKRAGSESS